VYCVWQVVKTPTIIFNNPVHSRTAQTKSHTQSGTKPASRTEHGSRRRAVFKYLQRGRYRNLYTRDVKVQVFVQHWPTTRLSNFTSNCVCPPFPYFQQHKTTRKPHFATNGIIWPYLTSINIADQWNLFSSIPYCSHWFLNPPLIPALILKQTTEAVSWIFTICYVERTSIHRATMQETAERQPLGLLYTAMIRFRLWHSRWVQSTRSQDGNNRCEHLIFYRNKSTEIPPLFRCQVTVTICD
jgi:hypothetical protein